MRRIAELVMRVYSGCLLLFFAFAPAWILADLGVTGIKKPDELDETALVALLICSSLLYFFLLLAFRAFTGKGRKSDGGLLPPLTMKVFAVSFALIAVLIVAFGVLSRDTRAIFGGVGYFCCAVAMFKVIQGRQRGEASPENGTGSEERRESDYPRQ